MPKYLMTRDILEMATAGGVTDLQRFVESVRAAAPDAVIVEPVRPEAELLATAHRWSADEIMSAMRLNRGE